MSQALSTSLAKLIRQLPEQQPGSRRQEAQSRLPVAPRLAQALVEANLPEDVLTLSPQQLVAKPVLGNMAAVIIDGLRRQSTAYGADYTDRVRQRGRGRFDYLLKYKLAETQFRSAIDRAEVHTLDVSGLGGQQPVTKILTQRDKTIDLEHLLRLGRSVDFMRVRISTLPVRAALDMNVSIRPGLATIDIITAGDGVDAQVQVETLLKGARTVRNFTVPMEGGLRVTPSTMLDSGVMKTASIGALFGDAGTPTLVSPS